MDTHSPSQRVLETVVTDDLLKKDVSSYTSLDKHVPALSKQVTKAYRRAKKAGEAQDAKARHLCAVLRAKREGNDPPVDLVIREENAAKVQTVLSDF